MRRVRELLRLKLGAGVPVREVARRIGIAPSTVRETLSRFTAAGLAWPLPETVTDGVLEEALFRPAGTKQGHRRRAEPDWAAVHRELKRKPSPWRCSGTSHRARIPDGYRYSRFCEHYRELGRRLSVNAPAPCRRREDVRRLCRRQDAGHRRPATGEVRPAQIFVAVMGASNLTYAEATWTQALADWIGAHTRAFAAFGAVPALVVPDNLKAAVIQACLFEPGGQPQLRRDGGALRHRDPAGPALQAPRQGEGRGRSAARGTLDRRPPAQPAVLQPRRAERRDRRGARRG